MLLQFLRMMRDKNLHENAGMHYSEGRALSLPPDFSCWSSSIDGLGEYSRISLGTVERPQWRDVITRWVDSA